jgi:hypothetical protein
MVVLAVSATLLLTFVNKKHTDAEGLSPARGSAPMSSLRFARRSVQLGAIALLIFYFRWVLYSVAEAQKRSAFFIGLPLSFAIQRIIPGWHEEL